MKGPVPREGQGTHLRLFTREAMRQAAVAALEQQKEEDREEWERWEARQLAREKKREGKSGGGGVDLDTTTRIAEAAAAAAMGDTEARLTQVLASASQDQLARMERAIRAMRGSTPPRSRVAPSFPRRCWRNTSRISTAPYRSPWRLR